MLKCGCVVIKENPHSYGAREVLSRKQSSYIQLCLRGLVLDGYRRCHVVLSYSKSCADGFGQVQMQSVKASKHCSYEPDHCSLEREIFLCDY